MTCTDCINYNECLERGDMAAKNLTEGAEKECGLFKNTADVVEVKHGKWYRHTKKEQGDTCFHCSVCEKMALSDCLIWELTDYCPHCGAKMDGQRK